MHAINTHILHAKPQWMILNDQTVGGLRLFILISPPCFSVVLAESSHDYYIKIVPTVYEDLWGNQNISYQYTFAYKVSWPLTYLIHFAMGDFLQLYKASDLPVNTLFLEMWACSERRKQWKFTWLVCCHLTLKKLRITRSTLGAPILSAILGVKIYTKELTPNLVGKADAHCVEN